MHSHKCICEPLGTQARPFKSLGTLPRKLLGTPICKPVSVTRISAHANRGCAGRRGQARAKGRRAGTRTQMAPPPQPQPPTLPPPFRGGGPSRAAAAWDGIAPIARSRSYVVQGAIMRARGHMGNGARWLWVHVGAQARGKSPRVHAWVGGQGLGTCRGLVRRAECRHQSTLGVTMRSSV